MIKFVLSCFFIVVGFFLLIDRKSIVRDMEHTFQMVGSKVAFAEFPITIPTKEKHILNHIKVVNDFYNNYGNLEHFKAETSSFFESMGNDKEVSYSVACTIDKVVNDVIQAAHKETAWVSIRAFTRDKEYDVPRWHTDGYYFKPFKGLVHKIVFTLKGPATLFYDMPEDVKRKFYKIGTSLRGHPKGREQIARLVDASKIYQPKLYSGVIFIAGDKNAAAVHSEPPIHEDRLFISIVPGSKEQIQEWQEKCSKDDLPSL